MTVRNILNSPKNPLLSIFVTAGYPKKDSLTEILPALYQSEVDFVEVGLPYSDPISDGTTIQHSSSVALENGIRLNDIFAQIEQTTTRPPVVLMGYFNVVLQYGLERFCQRCSDLEIEEVILPDLPLDLYLQRYQSHFCKYGVSLVFLVTPETSDERIRYIDQHSRSFIYAVSSSSTTGTERDITLSKPYFERLKQLQLSHPVLVGFNIRSADDFCFVSRYCRGGIVGSAYIRYIEASCNLARDSKSFVANLKQKNHDYTTGTEH